MTSRYEFGGFTFWRNEQGVSIGYSDSNTEDRLRRAFTVPEGVTHCYDVLLTMPASVWESAVEKLASAEKSS